MWIVSCIEDLLLGSGTLNDTMLKSEGRVGKAPHSGNP